jgi:hypothetical protein
MFKRASHIIVSVFLIAVTTGITINLHYCNNRLYSFRLFGQARDCCDDNHCGHCSDKSVKLEIHGDFIPVINTGLITEIIPFHTILNTDNDTGLMQVSGVNRKICLYDISPPSAKHQLALFQQYLL